MKLLLDTHTFIWTILDTERLPRSVFEAIRNENNDISISSVSYWEISIKYRLGKIDLFNLSTADLIPSAIKMGFTSVELAPEEAVSQHQLLENTHFDPFDRMLAWQAISRKLTLVSGDKEFKQFEKEGLKLFWK
jgi:PIN domain nuclease of toxin-antitoxin system